MANAASEPKKRGPMSKADKVAKGLDTAFAALNEVPAVTFTQPAEVIGLNEYIKTKERDGVVLVEVSHPDAVEGDVFQGVYSGIRLKKGAPSAKYSDGTTE